MSYVSKMTAVLTCAILVKYLSKYIYRFNHGKTSDGARFTYCFWHCTFFRQCEGILLIFLHQRIYGKKQDAWQWPFKYIRDLANTWHWTFLNGEKILLNKCNSFSRDGRIQITQCVYKKSQKFPKRDQTRLNEVLPPVIDDTIPNATTSINRHTSFKIQLQLKPL